MELPAGRARLLRFAGTVVLLGVFMVGAVSLVLERLSTIEDAMEDPAETTSVEPVVGGCDFVTDIDACAAPDPLDAPDLEGAIERYRAGVFASSDARFLVLSESDYAKLLVPVFGPATPQEGDVVMDVPVWDASFGGLDRSESFSWEQQWHLVGGAVMFEQIFVLGSNADAVEFLGNHEAFMTELGVAPVAHPSTGDGRDGSRPRLYRFVDADVSDPARRCVNRALVVLDRIVFSVSLMTGGDCSTPDPSLPAGVVGAVRDRAAALLG